MPKVIDEFRGDHRFLSNFSDATVVLSLGGEEYRSVEHAYQASKFFDEEIRERFRNPRLTAFGAKRLARKLKKQGLQRPDWEVVSLLTMEHLVRQKFLKHADLRAMLLATGDAEIVEGNYWHDNFFGACTCLGCADKPKLNHLGKILMRTREHIRQWQ
jgi:hypothetical protein